MDDGAAESAAILIALDAIGSARRGKEILGVEHRIANEFEGVSVETVCARLGDDVNDAARVGAVLRAVVAGLDAEFLERVGERKGLIDVGVFVHVVAAVELVADGILAGSICGESDGPGESLGGTLIGTSIRRVDRSGDKQSQLRGIAAVQRELRNALLFDDLLQDGRRRIHLESIARHRDHFRGHAQLQAHVYGKRLIREQGNPTFLGDAEALRLHAQVVGRRLQGGNHIEPLRIMALRKKPLPTSVAVTCAPATGAPAGSVTLPTILPKPCACKNRGAKRRAKKTNGTFFFMAAFLFADGPRLLSRLGRQAAAYRVPQPHGYASRTMD